jgi:hypothetical protein
MFGLAGWIAAPICPMQTMNFHAPRRRRSPCRSAPVDTLPHVVRSRAEVDDVGSDSATATAPVDPTGTLPSVIGVNVAPLSVVRNSPPLATPI